jgi:hypothetical protein
MEEVASVIVVAGPRSFDFGLLCWRGRSVTLPAGLAPHSKPMCRHTLRRRSPEGAAPLIVARPATSSSPFLRGLRQMRSYDNETNYRLSAFCAGSLQTTFVAACASCSQDRPIGTVSGQRDCARCFADRPQEAKSKLVSKDCRSALMIHVRWWHKPAVRGWAEHVRSARVFQTSTCSAIARASSTSMPR